ncbi:ABC-type glycerol-3-phosphate transport system permease component [Rhizobium azooxidifex]|uniref:ABC-type glycerol-3-phosphate transport system permease component n=1 Tax=Mycoplana azooxidifex TaxID=1636188 RepID=A0A7W6D7Y1_9HYPH|nr:carbohydrate ABC transporter permease [Mycoplana azooxidifex]MBB3978383.1 ABC-type glycerol-3-phosphate transport system permease component [Mycoplana azooxidifex]
MTSAKFRPRDVGPMVLVLAFVFVSIAPLLWMALAAFKPTADIIAIPPVWIPDFTYLQNFQDVLTQFWPFIVNSLIATVGATILALVLAVPTAFALVNHRFRGREALADWILSTRMMPPIAAAVPLFVIFRGAGLLDSLPGLIIAYAGFNLPFAVWMTMSFVRRVPKELIEAARLEGCTWWQVLTGVVLPLSKSGLAAVATFVFIFAWNEFMLALFLTTREAKTFPVVISSFIGTGRVYWEYIAAASVIQCLPPVLFTFFMQKHIVSGVTMGAVKD